MTISVRVRVRFDPAPIGSTASTASSAEMVARSGFAGAGVDELVVVFKELDPDALSRPSTASTPRSTGPALPDRARLAGDERALRWSRSRLARWASGLGRRCRPRSGAGSRISCSTRSRAPSPGGSETSSRRSPARRARSGAGLIRDRRGAGAAAEATSSRLRDHSATVCDVYRPGCAMSRLSRCRRWWRWPRSRHDSRDLLAAFAVGLEVTVRLVAGSTTRAPQPRLALTRLSSAPSAPPRPWPVCSAWPRPAPGARWPTGGAGAGHLCGAGYGGGEVQPGPRLAGLLAG